MNILKSKLYNQFQHRQVVKIITGINNTNISQIEKVAKAAAISNATYLDVVANTKIVSFLKSFSTLPICVSSIDPIDIYNCVVAGADMIELGNYDFLYRRRLYLGRDEILHLVKEVKHLSQDRFFCVTIPYYLNIDEQIKLAEDLESLGVDLLQTEGFPISQNLTQETAASRLYFANSLSTSLLSTYAISHRVSIPIIAASSITSIFANTPMLYGASGIGLGLSVREKNNIFSMAHYISQVKSSLIKTKTTDLDTLDKLELIPNLN